MGVTGGLDGRLVNDMLNSIVGWSHRFHLISYIQVFDLVVTCLKGR